jgi:CubicO group peptidase (beta-lactamase class C family)
MFRLRGLALLFAFVLTCHTINVRAEGAAAPDAKSSEPAAEPTFSDTGPDAETYGAAEGFPVGRRGTGGQLKYLVGSYSHFDEVVSARLVRRAETPWLFKRAVPPTISYSFGTERRSIADYLSKNPTTGLLIAKEDTILYEHYQYARTDHDRFLSQSMAKTVTSMLIGIALSENKIKSVDDLVSAYVPGLAETEYGKTPIRDLLHMASGVRFTENYDFNDDIAKLGRDLFENPAVDPVASVAQFNSRIEPPGTRWHYASVETEILGLVLRAAIGVPVADYLHDKIWKEIGTESNATWAIDGSGQEVTFCCISAVLRDYARFARLLAHDGAWEGKQIVPRQWVIDASTAQQPFLAPKAATPYFGYGYQLWILPGTARRFALLGIRGQIILVDPATKIVMVHTAVRPRPADPRSYAETLALWFGALEQLGK